MDHEIIETTVSELDRQYRDRLRFTGAAAIDQLMGRRNLDEQEGLLAYVDVQPIDEDDVLAEIISEAKWDVPEGDQELYLVRPESTPSAFPFGRYKFAEFDTVVEDYRRSNPRKFSYELENDSYFQRLLQDHLSSDMKDSLEEQYLSEF